MMRRGLEERVFRRLQVVGRASFSISLPKSWVLRVGLKPGDVLEISEGVDGSLRLSPPEARLRRSFCRLNADLCRDPEQLGAIVLAGYRVGYDIIQVTCSKSPIHELSRGLEGLIEGLPGFELDQGQNSELILRNVLDYSRFPADDLIKRSYILVSEMLNTVSSFLETGRYDLIPYIEALRRRVGELLQLHTRLMVTYFRRRELGRFLKLRNPPHIYSLILMENLMDSLAEVLLEFAKRISQVGKKVWSSSTVYNGLRRSLDESSRLVDGAVNAYLSLDLEQAYSILSLPKEHLAGILREEMEEVLLKDRELIALTAQAETAFIIIQSIVQRMAQLALDLFVESENPICEIRS
ncbi:MAG: AbrB/MazE/SpoVT family DNA-binding domain-containing protein [Thaumarchaeota archaeon]|jgi:phosphate uptake regulator|nr:AbrB/MazE/SpoVT family DNA-binding domain-containing protein [Candidatus Wolframiiraptor allenii]